FFLWSGRGEFAVLAHDAKDSFIGAAGWYCVVGIYYWRHHHAIVLRGYGAFPQGAFDFCSADFMPDWRRSADDGDSCPGTHVDCHSGGSYQPSTINSQFSMKRIGFIAMSGVRAHNAELTKLGLTLPGFVDRNRIIASLPSLGLLTLAGLTPEKFHVEYHEIADLRNLSELPDHFDLVALSTFTAQLKEAYDVADFYRAKGIPVVMGGITVSSLPDEAREHCLSVVVGEGEPSWPEVLRDFESGRLKPLYAQSPPGRFSLRDAPMPRFDLLNPAKYNRLTVQTSR